MCECTHPQKLNQQNGSDHLSAKIEPLKIFLLYTTCTLVSQVMSHDFQSVWIVAFASTLLIGLDIGLALGVIFSLLVIVIRTILPY